MMTKHDAKYEIQEHWDGGEPLADVLDFVDAQERRIAQLEAVVGRLKSEAKESA